MAEQTVTLSVDSALTSGRTSLEIWTTKLDHNLDKTLTTIPIPRTNVKDVNDGSWIIDIGRINRVISIQGMLADDDNSTAIAKKDDLVEMFTRRRKITLTWSGVPNGTNQIVYGNLQKCMITETAGLITGGGTNYSGEKNFAVQLSLVIGTNKIIKPGE